MAVVSRVAGSAGRTGAGGATVCSAQRPCCLAATRPWTRVAVPVITAVRAPVLNNPMTVPFPVPNARGARSVQPSRRHGAQCGFEIVGIHLAAGDDPGTSPPHRGEHAGRPDVFVHEDACQTAGLEQRTGASQIILVE